MNEEEQKKKKINRSTVKNIFKIFNYIKPYRLQYAVGMVFLLASTAASLVFPKLVGNLVDVSTQGVFLEEINKVALILILILLVQSITSYFRIVLFVNVTEKALADIRRASFNHLLRLPMSFFLGRRVGELNSRISADITLLQDGMTTTLAEFIRQVIIIFGGITFLVYTSWDLTLFMLSVVPIVIVLVVVFGRYIRKLSKKAQHQIGESNTIVEETLQGIQSVKAFTNELFEAKRYKKITTDIANTGMQNGRMRGAFSSFTVMALFGALAAVIWRGASLIGTGELIIGDFIAFIIYTLFIGGSIGGMTSVYGRLQKIVGATENLLEIFDEPIEEIEHDVTFSADNILKGGIVFKEVSFSYSSRPDTSVLKGINFAIQPDKLIALVGPSGGGKTTLTALLMRLYEPTAGKIYFDDKASSSISLTLLRSQIALVPQDIFLFGGTIRENIAYGRHDASEEDILAAADQANASEFIFRFDEGLDTLVGERGTQLSGGQRQRIAIARALLKNPKILILDEATSSLDSESERLVQDALEKLMKGRTSIVIAHRLATIRQADEILVLDKGQIVEKGTHIELMALNKGVYRGLSELQFSR
jgi:ABC-type multidrug transport system fused ATPase/permease subunit